MKIKSDPFIGLRNSNTYARIYSNYTSLCYPVKPNYVENIALQILDKQITEDYLEHN